MQNVFKKIAAFFFLLAASPLNSKEAEPLKIEIEMKKFDDNAAAFDAWYSHVRAWEGKLEDPPEAVDLDEILTKCGIRYTTYKAIAPRLWHFRNENEMLERFAFMTEKDHREIAGWIWFDSGASAIKDGRVAACFAEVVWASGHSRAVQNAANTIGAALRVDGVAGRKTISAVNDIIEQGHGEALFDRIAKAHGDHYIRLSERGHGHIKYLRGWLARHYIGYDSAYTDKTYPMLGFYQRFKGWHNPEE